MVIIFTVVIAQAEYIKNIIVKGEIMILLKQIVPKDFNLFLYGDDHEGSVLRHKEGWNKLIDMILSPYGDLPASCNFAVDHGDIVEALCTDDPRYDASTTSLNVTKQIKQAVKNREKIKKKLVVILDGNHPRRLKNFGEITSDICEELGVPFGTWSAKINYSTKNGDFLFKHHCVHGSRTITSTADDPKRRLANMELILKRLLKDIWGDCLVQSMGHTHKLLTPEPVNSLYLTDGGGKIKQNYTKRKGINKTEYIHPDHRWYVNTGAFYKLFENGVTSYAEVAGYSPIELGFAVARFRDGDIERIDRITI